MQSYFEKEQLPQFGEGKQTIKVFVAPLCAILRCVQVHAHEVSTLHMAFGNAAP